MCGQEISCHRRDKLAGVDLDAALIFLYLGRLFTCLWGQASDCCRLQVDPPSCPTQPSARLLCGLIYTAYEFISKLNLCENYLLCPQAPAPNYSTSHDDRDRERLSNDSHHRYTGRGCADRRCCSQGHARGKSAHRPHKYRFGVLRSPETRAVSPFPLSFPL